MRFIPGPEGCEFIDNYTPGGYHPVTIGDEFDNGRYKILHKLGSGGFATVWLARDTEANFNVALKICMAESSEWSSEVKIHQHFQAHYEGSEKPSLVAQMLDAFWHGGPNGYHRCIVTEVGGPSLADIRDRMKIRPDVVRDLSRQLLDGLLEVHNAGIVYGDFTAANVLFRPVGVDQLSEEEIYKHFGHPEPVEVRILEEDAVIDEHVPKYVYASIDTNAMRVDLIEDPEVMLIDFGEAYIIADEEKSDMYGNNLCYASPETIVMDQRATQPSDIWALACVMYEMRSGLQLVSDGHGSHDLIRGEMMDLIGDLPPTYLQKVICDVDPDGLVHHEEAAATPVAKITLYMRFASAFKWMCSFFWSTKNEVSIAEDHKDPKSLAGQVAKIGTWEPWCSMTRKQRIATYKKYLRVSGHPNDEVPEDVLNYGGPPPERLTPLEKTDFTDLLTSMLKWLPEDRPSLEQLGRHPYFHRYYLAEMTGPWLQKFHWGLKLGVRRDGVETVIC